MQIDHVCIMPKCVGRMGVVRHHRLGWRQTDRNAPAQLVHSFSHSFLRSGSFIHPFISFRSIQLISFHFDTFNSFNSFNSFISFLSCISFISFVSFISFRFCPFHSISFPPFIHSFNHSSIHSFIFSAFMYLCFMNGLYLYLYI